MAIIAKLDMQPNDTQDYDIDCSEWLPSGDNVQSVVLTCTPNMPTPPSYAISGQVVKLWIYQGGLDKTTYKITVRPTSVAGRSKEGEVIVKIKEV